MGYVNINGQARVFVQTGMDNSPKDAGASAALLSKTLGVSAGYINNGTEGIAGDVGEYLPNTLSKKDVLNEYTYRTLNAQGPTLIITHSAGNEDARKALQAGALYGHSYENLSFFSVGSPVSSSVLDKSVTGPVDTSSGRSMTGGILLLTAKRLGQLAWEAFWLELATEHMKAVRQEHSEGSLAARWEV